MKISLALGERRTLSRQTAWGCLTTNLALPGLGSLLAGRVSGYPQAALGLSGLALTLIFGARFILWYIANWASLHNPDADPLAMLGDLWLALRWPLLSFGIFLLGFLWALATSLQILGSARNATPPKLPPS
jgi:hypothetical protein